MFPGRLELHLNDSWKVTNVGIPESNLNENVSDSGYDCMVDRLTIKLVMAHCGDGNIVNKIATTTTLTRKIQLT